MRVLLLLLISLLPGLARQNGSLFLQSYLPGTYGASPQNWAVVQDARGHPVVVRYRVRQLPVRGRTARRADDQWEREQRKAREAHGASQDDAVAGVPRANCRATPKRQNFGANEHARKVHMFRALAALVRGRGLRRLPAGATIRRSHSAFNELDGQSVRVFDHDRSRIAERAYQLYLQRGGSDGDAERDWLEAEAQILEETSRY